MPRVIQRQITTTQIVSIQLTWIEESGNDPTPTEGDEFRSPKTLPVHPRKPRRRKLPGKAGNDQTGSDGYLPRQEDFVP